MAITLAERAAKFGFGDPSTWPGGEMDALITVKSIDQLKDIVDPGTDAKTREAHVQAIFNDIASNDESEALMRRVYHYVFGNDELSYDDRVLVDAAFPLQIRSIMAVDKIINTQWNLGMSGPPVYVELGTLTLEQGGFITISNTVLLGFNVENLIRNGSSGGRGDFSILGIPGNTGDTGTTPPPPGQAQNGSVGQCDSAGIAGRGGGPGATGATGTVGGTGGPGGDGLPSLAATFNIYKSVGGTVPEVLFQTASGSGGNGGKGGAGSIGGQGGNGGNGVSCGCTGNAGGNGGQGGTGGAGGVGAQGGNGVDAVGNVIIYVPTAYYNNIVTQMYIAQPGGAGPAGAGGAGGPGGKGGSGGKHNRDGTAGGQGAAGGPGTMGVRGIRSGKPATIEVQAT